MWKGGDFVRWFLKKYYNKDIKAIVDRWELSETETILHLWSFYYICEGNDLILNVTPQNVIDEFNDTDEDWGKTLYKEGQIFNLWEAVYGRINVKQHSDGQLPELTYYDWLEYSYEGVDIENSVKRQFTTGEQSHGYFPTDFRIFIDGLNDFRISSADAVLDIGSGKGSGVIALRAAGFNNVGAVEYTDFLYKAMEYNMQKLGYSYVGLQSDELSECEEGQVILYKGDATLMEEELNKYNWYFLFNPFSWDTMSKVLKNICKSLVDKPRKVYIFYAEPIAHQLILNTKMFKVNKFICNDYGNVSYYTYIYESII